MPMETVMLITAALLALVVLVRQLAGAARGKGCASCAEADRCLGQKNDQGQH